MPNRAVLAGSFNAASLRAHAEILDTLSTEDYIASGRLRVDRYESSAVTIRWHGDSAAVSSQVVSDGSCDGKPFATRLRVSQVWVRSDGLWRRAAFHDSPLAAPWPREGKASASAKSSFEYWCSVSLSAAKGA